MADSVREKVLKNIVTTLQAINGAGSYLTDLKSRVYRYGASYLDRPAYPLILVGEPTETVKWLNAQQQLVDVMATIRLDAAMIADPHGVTTPASTVISNLVADMILAILATPNRGGNAVETHIDSIEGGTAEETGHFCFAVMTIRVHYRFRSTDPTLPI